MKIRIFYKSSRLRTKIILGEVGKRTMLEPERSPPSFNRLLADTNRHLGDINERALGSGNDHLLHVVILLQVLLRILPRLITSQVELSFHVALE